MLKNIPGFNVTISSFYSKNRVDKREGKLRSQVNELDGQFALLKNMINQLEIKCNRNEQHTRCISLHMRGIEVPKDDRNDDVLAVGKPSNER